MTRTRRRSPGWRRRWRTPARSTTDAEFRHKLLTDSPSALAEFSGVAVDALPIGRINFVQYENAPTIVLPKFGQDLEELSDSQLEAVAGGTELITLFVLGVVIGVEAGVIIYEIAKASAK